MSRKVTRILVVLDDIGPGDALRSNFALDAIRLAQPGARITLLVSEVAAGVFGDDVPCDRVVVSAIYQSRRASRWRIRLYKLKETLRALRSVGVDHDVVFVLNWGTLTLDVLARLAGRTVFGFENGPSFLLSHSLGAYDVEGDPIAQNRALLAAAGIEAGPHPQLPSVAAPAPGHSARRPYAVLHTGTDWACQQWTEDRWAALGDWIVDELGLDVVFTGMAEEVGYIARVQGMMRRPSTSLAGRTDIADLREVIAQASLCVTVDSAPYELA
ncbi:MAG TPA: glycosyltransferase family 9 protein, partial [Candidatus Dormibacteraeota bacterium]|nr:glycosyltransferase family 9 protein [Candidatus Dormibacteraeota bacterium]